MTDAAITRRAALLGAATAGSLLFAGGRAGAQQRPAELKIGITTFLSGPASVFGVPARQTAEMIFEEINKAKLPGEVVYVYIKALKAAGHKFPRDWEAER